MKTVPKNPDKEFFRSFFGTEVILFLEIKKPVIVLTANDSLDEKIRMLTRGTNNYTIKPFKLRKF